MKAITDPEQLKKIGKLMSAGLSIRQVRDALKTEYGLEIGENAVKNAFDIYQTRRMEIIEGDAELKKELEEVIIDQKSQLQEINSLMREILQDAKIKKELRIAAANQILHQLEFQEKLLTRMSSGTKSVSKIIITQNIINSLDTLERQGFIKILRRPQEPIDITGKPVKEVKDGGNKHKQNNKKI